MCSSDSSNANPFVKRFYPNFDANLAPAQPKPQVPSPRSLAERALALGPGALLESMARAIYGWHLKRRAATWQSIDQVRLEAECLKLHTSSHRAATLERYEAGVARALQARRQRKRSHPEQIAARRFPGAR